MFATTLCYLSCLLHCVTCFCDGAAQEAGLLGFPLQLLLHRTQLGKLPTRPALKRLILCLQTRLIQAALSAPFQHCWQRTPRMPCSGTTDLLSADKTHSSSPFSAMQG